MDGNAGTRWASTPSDAQWLTIDLGATAQVEQVVLTWEAAYGSGYQIRTSDNGTSWTSIYTTTTGKGGKETLNVTGSGRYVQLLGTKRATGYGYSLWEVQVYGTPGGTQPPTGTCGTTNVAQGKTATASSSEQGAGTAAGLAVDGNAGTRWASTFADNQWWQVDLGASQCRLQRHAELGGRVRQGVPRPGLRQRHRRGPRSSTVTNGTGGTQSIAVSGTARYLRLDLQTRAHRLRLLAVGGVGEDDGHADARPDDDPARTPPVRPTARSASRAARATGPCWSTARTGSPRA